jgi:hypothetical protein
MLGAIAAIAIVIWYYKGAIAVGKNPINSVIAGLLVYFLPAIAWTIFVTPGLRDVVEHNPGMILGMTVRYGFVVVGVACAAFYYYKVLTKDSGE